MRQTILSEPVLVLPTTETAGDMFPEDWEGHFQLVMTVAGSANAKLEVLQPGSTTWIDVRTDGKAQNLTRAGDTYNIYLARGFNYRVETTTAGAEVYIASL